MKNFSRRLWLLALPLLLLAVAAFVRWRAPKPSSPADAWLWEQGERASDIVVETGDWSGKIGLTDKGGYYKKLTISGRRNIRAFCRSLHVIGKFSPSTDDSNAAYGMTITINVGNNLNSVLRVKFDRQRKRYYLALEDKGAVALRAVDVSRFFAHVRMLTLRATRKDPHLQLEAFDPGN